MDHVDELCVRTVQFQTLGPFFEQGPRRIQPRYSDNTATFDALAANSRHLGAQTESYQMQTRQRHPSRYQIVDQFGSVLPHNLRVSRRRQVPRTCFESGCVQQDQIVATPL
jgi:hypothetical protein